MSATLPFAGEVHVWRLALAALPSAAEEAALTAEETARMARFAFPRERRRFVRARAGMRRILGEYLSLAPRAVPIAIGENGKPRLEGIGLGFNLSHSGDHALLAVARSAHIGVDLEEHAARVDMRLLAADLFTAQENDALAGLEGDRLDARFLACWTRKEAVLKALGVGLSLEPRRIHVGADHARREVVVAGGSPHPLVELASLDLGPGSSGAVAVVGGFESVSMRGDATQPARAVAGHSPWG